MNISCSATPCPIILNTKCVIYEGANLVYTGILTNDSVQTALQKIDNIIGNISAGGLVGLTLIGNSPNSNGATLSSGILSLEPASSAFGGVVTTLNQNFEGEKTFNDKLTLSTITNAATDTDKFLVSNLGVIEYRTGAQLLSDIGGGSFGTVTSVGATGGTGINVTGSPITTSGSFTIINTAPDQVVSISSGTAISITGIYPNFTITNDEPAGNAITELTGEATAIGPGSVAITLNNSAVINKVLTGLNVIGSNIVSTDTILEAFGKTQNQINALVGGLNYQGVWNASTNTPTLTSSVGVKGYYYKVSVAGNTTLNGNTDWQIGDLAIYNGTAWDKVDNTDSVSSVNGYTGAVSLVTSDIPEAGGILYFNNARGIAATLTGYTSGSGTITSADSILSAIQKLNGNIAAGGTAYINNTTSVQSSSNFNISGAGVIGTTLNIGQTSFNNKWQLRVTDNGAGNNMLEFYQPDITSVAAGFNSQEFFMVSAANSSISGYRFGGVEVKSDGFISLFARFGANMRFTSSGGFDLYTSDAQTFKSTFTQSVTADRIYTFPDATGTVALLQSAQTFSGINTFSTLVKHTRASNASTAMSWYKTDATTNGEWRLGLNTSSDDFVLFNDQTNSTSITVNATTNAVTFLGAVAAPSFTGVGATLTGDLVITKNALGSNPLSPTQAILLQNTTAAILGTQQISPSLHLKGNAWNTTGSVSESSDWQIFGAPYQGSFPGSQLTFAFSRAGGSYTTNFTFDTSGAFTTGSAIITGLTAGGMLKATASSGVVALATAGTDYQIPYWTRASTTLSPVTANDNLNMGTGTGRFGNIGISTSPTATVGAYIVRNVGTGGNSVEVWAIPTITASIGYTVDAFKAQISLPTGSLSVGAITYFSADIGTFGTGNTVGNIAGFRVGNSLGTATNTYAYASGLNTGTNVWNLFMSGTAKNYLEGNLQIGSSTATVGAEKLQVTGTASISSTLLLGGALTGTSIITSLDVNIANARGVAFRNAANTAYRYALSLTSSNIVDIGNDTDIAAINLAKATTGTSATMDSYLTSNGGTSTRFYRGTNTGGSFTLARESNTGGTVLTGSIAYATVLTGGGNTNPVQIGVNDAVVATFLSGGNVGIGTASPITLSGYTNLSINNATNGGFISLLANGTETSRYISNATNTAIGSIANTSFQIFTNNTTALTIGVGGTLTTTLGTGAVQATAGVLSVVSDSRVKDLHGEFQGSALEAIRNMSKPQYWNYNSKSGLPSQTYIIKQFGHLADKVYDVLGEEFAPTQRDGNHTLADRAIQGLHTLGLQELLLRIEQLEQQLAKRN